MRVLAICFGMALLFSTEGGAQSLDTVHAGIPQPWRTLEDKAQSSLADLGLWVGGVVVNFDSDHFSMKTYGTSQPGGTSAPALDAAYEIGSVSKSFTGILLALALEEIPGLSVDEAIGQYLPEVNNSYVAGLTFKQLATHSAGFPDDPQNLFTDPKMDPANPYGHYDESLLMDFLNSAQPVPALVDTTNPGTYIRSYSNVGFATLGLVLTRIYGNTYDVLVHDKIAVPLGMSHTFVSRKDSALPKALLQPYGIGKNLVSHMPMDIYAPAGAIVSTVTDMARYLRANARSGPGRLGRAIRNSHQLGLGWDSLPGDGVIWKNGQTTGFATFMGYIPSSGKGVVVLSNMYNMLADYVGALPIVQTKLFPTSNIYTTFANFSSSTLPVASSLLSEAPGKYFNSDGQGQDPITFSANRQSLLLSSEGKPFAVALSFPSTGNLWLFNGAGNAGSVSFDQETPGAISGLTLTLPGIGTYRYTRDQR